MRKRALIAEIISLSQATVHTWDPLSGVYRLMKANELKHMPVLGTDEQVCGVISRSDIKRLGFGYKYEQIEDIELGMFDMLQAGQVMATNPPIVSSRTTVMEASQLLNDTDLVALPVVDNGKAIGVIDIHEIIRFLLAG
ncbi:CBS domain-containing protein [Parapedobacter composti]|uniref:CBS domain-containing protein n=1 Tax=Parapedobacter composti TaxID=623281 RepID=A0A1I1DYI9_9SPHI|nr:CBS domain-containing protein [Parapedobacter composti]SFB77663.1 CBS domain-containing protein [Parapedobacter composti]